jgi:hypothetical protein
MVENSAVKTNSNNQKKEHEMSDMNMFYNTVIAQGETNPYRLLAEASLEDIQPDDIPGWDNW